MGLRQWLRSLGKTPAELELQKLREETGGEKNAIHHLETSLCKAGNGLRKIFALSGSRAASYDVGHPGTYRVSEFKLDQSKMFAIHEQILAEHFEEAISGLQESMDKADQLVKRSTFLHESWDTVYGMRGMSTKNVDYFRVGQATLDLRICLRTVEKCIHDIERLRTAKSPDIAPIENELKAVLSKLGNIYLDLRGFEQDELKFEREIIKERKRR